ncbi:uncharacterized protein LOC105790400 [Gossypium raimondii]|uniref:Nucleoporin protein Ndc1-Nup n=2 Tax=Gossypium TaxID=3633 RepID=A0A0D2QS21_GOSRA|nr:uncharacterized protein LOC105790400 [Gossypium raimondii]KJB22472.1 hypothetical protein B456_004G048400 [Gossypium raimondii]KJB22473.1 hypothetical protein B456_004G048400 [Gossypium raimondii]KJB22474.1 hypothetical protein B456_004G048400 [Gossypium raimondii]
MCSWTAAESDMVVKNRLVGFLLWQSILSSLIFLAFTITIVSWRSATAIFVSFFSFHLSQLLFSVSLSTVLSPQPKFRRILPVLLTAAAVSGSLSAVSFCGFNGRVGFKGFASGLFYASFYVYKRRWVLQFPIIQRPLFFSFKMGIPSAIIRALKLSAAAYLFSVLLLVFLPHHFSTDLKLGNFFTQHIISYAACFSMFLCWELTHHLHQVLHTKRFIFAPPKGSAAAETNPSEPLLATLEECSPASLLKYLAYLDLCMVCENNVDYWRRAAFFEETGETYKRVAAVCLRPLEQLASKLVQGFEGSSDDKIFSISDQLQSPTNPRQNSKCHELVNDFQVYTWSARALASLTSRSRKEDRFGVAQLSGSNAAAISTLIACLLAVETLMGKKISLQPSHQLMGAFSTKSATFSTGRRDVRTGKRRDDPLYSKAYAMADVLRTSIYGIVSAFHHEMLNSAKAGLLEKDWITSSKPPFGTRELLLQKLHLFLDFQAS